MKLALLLLALFAAGWPYVQPPFEKGCHYGTGTACPCPPHTYWATEVQGCVNDNSEENS
jgi:hypothetical protein